MNSLKSLLFLTPLLAVLGCHGGDASLSADSFRPQQVVLAGDLRDEISFSPVMTHYTAGILHVDVPVQSSTDLDIDVSYRFTFLDDGRQPVGSSTPWQTKVLHSNQFETISGDAPAPAARDFRLEIRSAH